MSKKSIVFLMYHELECKGRKLCQSDPGYARYVVSEADFSEQMQFLKSNGWQGVCVSQALGFPPGNNVVITFDDGCESDALAAAPILRQTGFSATFFITCGRLGKPGYLSATQLRELGGEGFEIGCHSMTHPYLTDLDQNELRREICEAKSQLEQITGRPVHHFSCPGGRYDHRVVTMARAAGYKTLATSRIEANSRNTDKFELGRVAILRDTPILEFAAICRGHALSGMRMRGAFREVARKMLGNSWYDRVRATLLRGAAR